MEKKYNKFQVEYSNGSNESFEFSRVWQYAWKSDDADINPQLRGGSGSGCGIEYLMRSLEINKPIIIVKESGKPDIEKIINSTQIKSIKLLD